MADINLVQKAGWFAAKSFEGKATPASGVIKIKCGAFRPRFEINTTVYLDDFSKKDGVIDLVPKTQAATTTEPAYNYLELHTDATVEVNYRVLLME